MKRTKKVIALLLAVVMLGSTLAIAMPTIAFATDISSAGEFGSISNGGNYKLTSDITISSTLSAKDNVTIDGNGYTITISSGMKSGVFAKLTNSTLKNLTVKAENDAVLSFNSGNSGVSPVVGTFIGGTIENVTNEVSVTVSSGVSWFGGIVGNAGINNQVATCYITNCTNKGDLISGGGEYLGGIAGVNFSTAYYEGCKNYGDIYACRTGSGRNDAGGIVGYVYSNNNNSKAYFSNCISVGSVSSSKEGEWHEGAFVGRNDNTDFIKQLDNCYNFTTTSDFGSNAVSPVNTSAVYITSAAQLSTLSAGGYDLPAGVCINGNGYAVTLKNATSGLFTAATDATIVNLNIAGAVNVTASGNGGVGALINAAQGSLVLRNIKNTANITVSGSGYSSVGGLVGSCEAEVRLTACNNYGSVSAATAQAAGGIIGTASAALKINSCSSHGTVTGTYAAGIIGSISSTAGSAILNGAINTGACVSTFAPAVAGICAKNEIGNALKMTGCKDYSNDATVQAVSLKLRDEASLLFYVGDAVFAGAEEVSVETESGDKAVELAERVTINGLTCRVFAVNGIDPTRFGETIKLTVSVKKNGTTYDGAKSYSVKEYCMSKINSSSTEVGFKRFCVDMLNYGAEAQKKAGVTGSALVNASLTSAQKALGTSSTPTTNKTSSFSGTVNAAVAEWVGAELKLEKEIAPVFTFTAANGVEGMEAKISYGEDGGTYTVSSFKSLGNNKYSFKLNGLTAAAFKHPIVVKLQNSIGSSQQYSFSIEAYISNMISAGEDADLAAAALKYIDSVELFMFDVVTYDIEKYTAPVWEGNVVYAESAFVRENSKTDSSVAPITLLYPIDDIISVRSSDMKTLYEEGVDYTVVDGKLVIKTAAEGGHIRILPYYSDTHAIEAYTYPISGTYSNMQQGGVYYYYRDPMNKDDTEGGIVKWNVSVTYRHSGQSVITKPTDQSSKFEGLMDKLVSGKKLNVVSLGDSITAGCSASLNHKMGPWGPKAPAYNQMFCDYLEAAYGVTANHINLGVGGKTSSWGNEQTQIDNVCNADPDIFIVAFGMNEGGWSTDTHANNIKSIVDKVKARCPDVYVIVVSTCLLGQDYSTSNGNRPKFGIALMEKFKNESNVVVADVSTVDVEMEGYDTVNETNHTGPKSYQDLTGSNSNHPNDFMHRIYVQTMVQAAFGENKFAN